MAFFDGFKKLFGWTSMRPGGGWLDFGDATRSKINVTTETAMSAAAVLCAARVIAEGVSQCPLKLYEETDEEDSGRSSTQRRPARKHPLYDLLAYAPCHLTAFEFREMLTIHAVIEGNGYALINRGGIKNGRILELVPILPTDIRCEWNEFNEPVYILKDGTLLARENIFHIRGPSWDGLLGMSVRKLAAETIGLSIAMENSHADLFGKSARPSGILTTEEGLAPEKIAEIKANWAAAYGPNAKGGVAILDKGFKFMSMAMTATDAQYVETRKFLIEEVGRAMRVFPQMLMHSDKASTFASASEFFRAHVIHTLGPWFTRWEEAIKRDLIGFADATIWPRFSVDAMLRGDPRERAEFYREMIQNGIMSPNEVRALENLNPREGGDEYLTPLNMRLGADDGAADGGDDEKKARLRAV